jgi:hypothetical protein
MTFATTEQVDPQEDGLASPKLRSMRVVDQDAQTRAYEPEDNEEGPCDAFTKAFTSPRKFGIGFCGRLFDYFVDPAKAAEANILDLIKQHRPYFTFWITFVQILVCIVSIFTYGLAPVGFSWQLKRGLATTTNLEKQLISFPVKQNFWIGPAAMDLVHLGAKYAPCMRNDTNIHNVTQHSHIIEIIFIFF